MMNIIHKGKFELVADIATFKVDFAIADENNIR